MTDISQIKNEALAKIFGADMSALESLKIEYLGKSGVLTQVLKSLAKRSIEEKRFS